MKDRERHPVRIGALVAATATLLVTVAVLAWNTQNHEARIGVAWLVTATVVATAAWLDLRSLPPATMGATLIVATAWLYFVGFVTVMVIVFGWVFGVVGVVVGLPGTGLAWVGRRRIIHGHVDGAALTLFMLGVSGAVALSRPWSPSSPQWFWVAGVAFAGCAVVLADLVRNLVHRVLIRADSVGGRL